MAGIESRSVDVVSLLLNAGAGLQISTRIGTPLQRAVELNDREMVTFLIAQRPELITQGLEGHSKATGNGSALAAAAAGGHNQIVSILLQNGFNVDTSRHDKSFHVLHQAASQGMLDLVKYCLEVKKCDIDMTTDEGFRYREGQTLTTPLALACVEGHLETVRYLLSHGASIEHQDNVIPTLALAAMRGHSAIVKLLIEHHRARSNEQDTDRFLNRVGAKGEGSALFQATWSGSLETLSILMDQGARCHARKNSLSPLHAAAELGRPDLVARLIQKYVGDPTLSIDAPGPKGTAPIVSAIQADSMPVISVLLDHGASLATLDDSKNSPFHYATVRKQEAILKLLLSVADRDVLPGLLDQRNNIGNTALKEAVRQRDRKTIGL